MIERWSRDQVLALAPDASSQKGAQSVGTPAKWSALGSVPDVLWGECKGSGSSPYRACVDLGEPAYRCSCPSRKFPCKHALGLLLLWSADGVSPAEAPPAWVAEWLDQRRVRAAKASATTATAQGDAPSPSEPGAAERREAGSGDGAAADRRAAQREERVATGLSELERWLADQVGQGLAGARQSAPAQWQELTRRLVDAQAPGAAAAVSRLPRVLAEEDWPARLLGEYGLLNLLAVGYRRASELPAPLRDTIRSRVGFPTSRDEVLAGHTLRDHWDVLGQRDEEQDRLVSRRVWLRGRSSGRSALLLSFAPVGQALDASLVTGTSLDADLAFYPGGSPLRALVAARHGGVPAGPPGGGGVRAALAEVAAALEGDPWLESWPVVLGPVVPAKRGDLWLLADAASPQGPSIDAAAPPGPSGNAAAPPGPLGDAISPPESSTDTTPSPGASGDAASSRGSCGDPPVVEGMPLHPSAGLPWRLLAVSGGHGVTVAAEWTPRGLRPLTTWDEEGQVVVL
ncbi:SWIM zinc finger domain-containing protein [Sphaerisporangium sp. NBC_01403]|uniref:SWIM zinc finger family protein n=1 Tax=Sphaerisporangium sp. NBC_01403 TaxID=2903599 RepID=UPI00325296B1